MKQERLREEQSRALQGLSEKAMRELSGALRSDGISDLRYTVRGTQLRETSVRHGALRSQTEAEDMQLCISGSFEGKRARCCFAGFPDAKTASALLRESAALSEETADQPEKNMGKAQKEAPHEARAVPEAKPEDQKGCDTLPFVWETQMETEAALIRAEACGSEVAETVLVETCRFEQHLEEIRIFSGDGALLLSDESGYHCMRAAVIAEKNGSREYTWGCRYGRRLRDTEPEALVRKIAEEAAGGLFGKSLPSGTYRVILKGSVAAELTEAFLPAFFESRLKDGQSAVCGREKQLSASFLSLREDPFFSAGRMTRRADDEGTPVSPKYLMKDGGLCTRLCKSPEKAGEPESTGNGFQPDPQSDVETGVTNVILESDGAHRKTREALFELLSDGLYVTGIDGTFAGTNVKTGTFSLIARGQVILNGKPAGAFREVTIAADFFDMLTKVRAAGETLAATPPDLSCVLAPDLLTEDIVVSGL